ncbi:MAG: GFA family protein [Thiolinea sp.]
MSETIKTGSCMCGQVHYEVRGELRPVCACHCTLCRKSSGHYVAATSAPNENLTVHGDSLRWYKSSDYAERAFCGNCGGNLFYRPFGKGSTSIFAGTLDGDTGLKIESQLYPEDKGDYYELPDVPVIDQSELSAG